MSASTTSKDETPAAGRRRRAFGTVERLSSGNFRARVLCPEGKYVSAPMTFATRADATLWVDLQRADQVRGMWQVPAPAPARWVDVWTVGEYVQEWITQHPSARPGTKELYTGLLRTCIVEDRDAAGPVEPEYDMRARAGRGGRASGALPRPTPRRAGLRRRGRRDPSRVDGPPRSCHRRGRTRLPPRARRPRPPLTDALSAAMSL